jgi:hypothetical protein
VVSRAEEYRRLAQECLDTARTIANEDARDALLQMAQVWQRLAEQQETTANSNRSNARTTTRKNRPPPKLPLVRFPTDSVPNQAYASFIIGRGLCARRRWLRD